MTSFWSAWIIVLTSILLIIVTILLFWNFKNYTHVDEGESMGHTFDGIEELNNPLPKWWSYLFIFCLVWGVFYLIAYPGMGNWQGLLKWKSANYDIKSLADSRERTAQAKADGEMVQYDREISQANEYFGPVFEKFANQDLIDLAYNEEALKIGQRLYLQNCALCHGSDARGGPGFPNLTDNNWLYGGSPEAIKETLLYGRIAAMPAWGDALGEQGVKEMTSYVLSLSGRVVDQQEAEAGKAKFAMCAACHGMDGKGSLANNLPMGAPNLTDDVWLYGGSRKAVEATLLEGRNGVMPAWKDILGEQKVHILSAYVYRLSNPEAKN